MRVLIYLSPDCYERLGVQNSSKIHSVKEHSLEGRCEARREAAEERDQHHDRQPGFIRAHIQLLGNENPPWLNLVRVLIKRPTSMNE